jgi:hypothetical protein
LDIDDKEVNSKCFFSNSFKMTFWERR